MFSLLLDKSMSILVKFYLRFSTALYIRSSDISVHSLFFTLSFIMKLLIADQICLENLFEASLDAIFFGGNKYFLCRIRSRGFSQSITGPIQISYKTHPLLKGTPSCLSLVYLAKKVRGDAPSHVYWKKICQRNLRKRHNMYFIRRFNRAQCDPVSGRLTFVRISTIKVSAASLFAPRILRPGYSHRRTILKTFPICHSRCKIDLKIQRVPEELLHRQLSSGLRK